MVNIIPFVQVNLWAGQTPETKKKIVQGITQIFVDLKIPPEAITIMINEIPLENWATAGQQHSHTSLKQPA